MNSSTDHQREPGLRILNAYLSIRVQCSECATWLVASDRRTHVQQRGEGPTTRMAGAEVKRALHTIRPAAVDRNALCKMNAQLVAVSTRGLFKSSQVAEPASPGGAARENVVGGAGASPE